MTESANLHSAGGSIEADKRVPAVEPSAQPLPHSTDIPLDYLWNAARFLNEDTRFADTKAATVILAVSAVIAALFGTGLHAQAFSKWPWQWGLLEALSVVAYAFLGAGVFFAAWAIKPRLTNLHPKGFLFWGSIRGYQSHQDFWESFCSHDSRRLAEHLAHHIHTLAGVCQRKYFWVGLSMWASLLGALCGALAVLLKDVLAHGPK